MLNVHSNWLRVKQRRWKTVGSSTTNVHEEKKEYCYEKKSEIETHSLTTSLANKVRVHHHTAFAYAISALHYIFQRAYLGWQKGQSG